MSHHRFSIASWPAVLLVAALVGSGCGVSLTPAGGSMKPARPTPAQIASFLQNARITLPASSSPLLYLEVSGGPDGVAWLSVNLPKADLQSFLQASPFRDAMLKPNDEYYLGDFSMLWQTQPTTHRSGQVRLPNAQVLNILIDETDPATATIYLMWHET
jgi:hypothetical protein